MKQYNPVISVIIPVYNAGKYLDRSIESVLNQTLKDIEIILVDDGSKDNSGEICDTWAKKDSRVSVIHIANAGVSNARRTGVEASKGAYIIHVDADDWMESDYLMAMYSVVKSNKSVDVVISDYYKDCAGKSVFISQCPKSTSPEKLAVELFHEIHGSVWNKLISRACIERNGVEFNTEIRCKEDWLFIQQLLCDRNLVILYLNKAGYHYETNPDSITMSSTDRVVNLKNDMKIIGVLEKFEDKDAAFVNEVNTRKLRVKFDMVISGMYTVKEARQIYPECDAVTTVMKSSLPCKIKIFMMLYAFGITFPLRMISKIH